MAEKIMVRPGPGRTVRLENGRKLTPDNTPAEGVLVVRNIYIDRRLICGDLVQVEPQPAAINKAPPALPAASTTSSGA